MEKTIKVTIKEEEKELPLNVPVEITCFDSEGSDSEWQFKVVAYIQSKETVIDDEVLIVSQSQANMEHKDMKESEAKIVPVPIKFISDVEELIKK